MKTDLVIEADQEDDKSATEIAGTCNDRETGEPPGGAGVVAKTTKLPRRTGRSTSGSRARAAAS